MKIGLCVVTCSREIMLNNLLKSLRGCIDEFDELVIVNDGDDVWISPWGPLKYHYIRNKTNLGVGKSKNKGMKHLLDKGCDYIFVIEDDMIIKDPKIFEEYIKASKISGLQHFLVGTHGPINKRGISGGKLYPRKVIDYGNLQIALYQHCVGAFCFYTRECLEAVGLHDENYLNAFEHVDHSYMLAKAGYCTPYWWWPDIENSTTLIEEQACSEESSTIRPRKDWQQNIQDSFQYFYKKHGVTPTSVPDTDFADVKMFLKSKLLK